MAIILPDSSEEVVSRIQTDVKGELPTSNPWLKDSFIRAVAVGLGNRVFDFYYQLKQSINESFPNTAQDEYLQMWADLKNMNTLVATPATGSIVFTGTLGTTVGAGTVVTVGAIEYTTIADSEIVANAESVSTLTRSGTTALCTTSENHDFANGNTVVISGVNEAGWDASYTITVTGLKSFTFEVDVALISPATGTIIATMTGAISNIICSENGDGTNQDGGIELALQTPQAGVNDECVAGFEGLQGGANDETEADYQDRVVDRWRNPQTPFNPATIAATIRNINGNTRVWVHRVYPVIGAVTAYFVRDGDTSIIPSVSEVETARLAVVEIAPANTEETDVHIEGCIGDAINIEISNLVPDNLNMRTAVEQQITSYYRGYIDEGENHTVDGLKSQILQSYNTTNGEKLSSFTLVSPTVDQTINIGHIAIEGTVLINN